MPIRFVTLAVTLATLTLAGCGSSPPKQQPSASEPSSSATAETSPTKSTEQPEATETASASEPLSAEECVEVTSARLDIILASNAEEARPPAETLKSYNPPPSVVEAIDHFVEVGGIQFEDPDANAHSEALEAWVGEVCR